MIGRTRSALLAAFVATSAGAWPLVAQADATPPEPVLARFAFGEPAADWRLPGRLAEISGLAFTADGRLLAHADEQAIIYEVDLDEGELIKGWAFGDTPAPGDFEGIAVAHDRVWLVTSDGRLYEGPEGEDDERVLYNTYGTGVGRNCEVEGLVYEPTDETLLLVCKTPRTADLEDHVGIYRWSIEGRRLVGPFLRVPVEALTPPGEEEAFRASGIERDPATGHYLLIAAQQERIAELTPSGEVVAVSQLDARAHRQAEGVALRSDGVLIIADEGSGRRARLTLYAPRP